MFDLTPAQYAATIEKIAKINTRARRRGFTGHLEVTGHQPMWRGSRALRRQ